MITKLVCTSCYDLITWYFSHDVVCKDTRKKIDDSVIFFLYNYCLLPTVCISTKIEILSNMVVANSFCHVNYG